MVISTILFLAGMGSGIGVYFLVHSFSHFICVHKSLREGLLAVEEDIVNLHVRIENVFNPPDKNKNASTLQVVPGVFLNSQNPDGNNNNHPSAS